MADLADIENAMKALIVGWCYPNGTSQPSAIKGALPVRVVRGWPNANDLKASFHPETLDPPQPGRPKSAFISIYAAPGSERQTTRYPREWQTLTNAAPTITATLAAGTITLGGTVTTPQLVAVLAYGRPFVYAVQQADTLATIAAALTTMISASGQATSNGAVLTVPSPKLGCSVGGFGTMWRELRRQERLIMVTVWCATPEQRDAVAGLVDNYFAGAGSDNGLEFINLPDGSMARLQYARTMPTDVDQLSGSFRRDLIYSLEYATTETASVAQVVAFDVVATANGAPASETISVVQVTTTPIVVTPQPSGALDFSDPTNSGLIAPIQ